MRVSPLATVWVTAGVGAGGAVPAPVLSAGVESGGASVRPVARLSLGAASGAGRVLEVSGWFIIAVSVGVGDVSWPTVAASEVPAFAVATTSGSAGVAPWGGALGVASESSGLGLRPQMTTTRTMSDKITMRAILASLRTNGLLS